MIALILALFLHPLAYADEPQPTAEQLEQVKKFEESLQWKQGDISLHNGLAKLSIPPTFHYLDHANTVRVLKAWGNDHVGETLGMLFPSDKTPFSKGSWGVLIEYSDDGHVKDDDAKAIDYTKLLTDMQASIREGAEARKKNNEPEVELLGWATPPSYDSASHKMFWAKEIRFGGSTENTLNYNIRVLGKEGVLVLNAIARMDQLAIVQKETPTILGFVDFTPGNRYADFQPGVHKLAGYGLAGLVAGGAALGVAGKLGLFKVLITALIALKKFVIVGAVAAIAAVKKFLGRDKGTGTKTA